MSNISETWQEWEQRQKAKQAQAYREMGKQEARLPIEKHPISERMQSLLKNLSRCTFGVGTWDKRFVRDLQGVTEISKKQEYWILKMTF